MLHEIAGRRCGLRVELLLRVGNQQGRGLTAQHRAGLAGQLFLLTTRLFETRRPYPHDHYQSGDSTAVDLRLTTDLIPQRGARPRQILRIHRRRRCRPVLDTLT